MQKLYRCEVEDQRDPNLRCYEQALDKDEDALIHFKRIFGDRLKRIFYTQPSMESIEHTVIWERR